MRKKEKKGFLEKLSTAVSIADIIKFVIGLLLGGAVVGSAVYYGVPELFESECPDCICKCPDCICAGLDCPDCICPEFNYSRVSICEIEYICWNGDIVKNPEECPVS